MRFELINAANYLVWRLQYAGQVETVRDDGDLILLERRTTRQRIMVHLVERLMSLQDMQHHFRANEQQGWHTLMIFWVDMLLPLDGKPYLMDDWMEALVSVYGDKIYGFEVAGREAYFFPVYFHGSARQRNVHYGNIVDYSALGCSTVTSDWWTLRGTWRIANFDSPHPSPHPRSTAGAHPLAAQLRILGLNEAATLAHVKQAYYDLARRYHPDLNRSAGAAQRMKHINAAYQRLVQYFEKGQ